MANPLIIKSTGGGTFLGLQEMQTSQMDYAVHQVLTEFNTDNVGTGTLNIGAGGSSRGTYIDTVRDEDVGVHPSTNAITSTTYTAFQNTTAVSETSMSHPLFVNDSGYAAEHSNNLNTVLVSRIQANLVANGLGSYWMSQSNPNTSTHSDTGYYVDNTIRSAEGGTSTVRYKLWRKTKGVSAPTTVRPAKLRATSSIKEMSDAELKSICARLRNRIGATGIGEYKLATSDPSGSGQVWRLCSDAMTDTRQTLADQSYTGNYLGQYSTQFLKSYAGFRTIQFTKQYQAVYEKAYTKAYVGVYLGQYTKEYAGQ